MNEHTPFIPEFDSVKEEEWKERLERDLKGIGFDDLTTKDRNGIVIRPFYTQSDNPVQAPPLFQDWFIMERLSISRETNEKALFLLNNGVSGLELLVDSGDDIRWDRVLKDIDLNYIFLKVSIHDRDLTASVTGTLEAYLNQQYPLPGSLNIQVDSPAAFTTFGKTLSINATIYNNAGSTAIFELGACLSQINEALASVRESDRLRDLDTIYINLSTDTQFFEQIAKIRAIRLMAEQVLRQYDCNARIFLSVETSQVYLSAADAPNNILRNAIAGMSAAIGGADSLLVHPFSYSERPEFTSRIGRNQQLLFKEESYLNAVADKGYGSYFIETYTQKHLRGIMEDFSKDRGYGWME
ncbi:MAG: hypothetical protein KL787_05510 [Taibaiella sp.]|nr:hypothetical protein [Taibaiella sp.]